MSDLDDVANPDDSPGGYNWRNRPPVDPERMDIGVPWHGNAYTKELDKIIHPEWYTHPGSTQKFWTQQLLSDREEDTTIGPSTEELMNKGWRPGPGTPGTEDDPSDIHRSLFPDIPGTADPFPKFKPRRQSPPLGLVPVVYNSLDGSTIQAGDYQEIDTPGTDQPVDLGSMSRDAFSHLDPAAQARMQDLGVAPKSTAPAPQKELTSKPIRGRSTMWGLDVGPGGQPIPDPGDKQDPQGKGFFNWGRTRDPDYEAVSVPYSILEAAFGPFASPTPGGGYSMLHTPEAKESVDRIKRAVVPVTWTDSRGREITNEFPIADVGPAEWTHNVLDMTWGARKKMGMDPKDNHEVSYTIKDEKGVTQNVDQSLLSKDKSPVGQFRARHPEFARTPTSVVVEVMHKAIAPQMNAEQFTHIATDQNGFAAFKEAAKHAPPPIERLKQFPQFRGLNDDEIVDKAYRTGIDKGTLPKNYDYEEFRDYLIPPTGFGALMKSFSGEVGAGIHNTSAGFYNALGKLSDLGDAITRKAFSRQNLGEYNARLVDEWAQKNLNPQMRQLMGAAMEENTYFRDLSKFFYDLGKQQEAAQQRDVGRAQSVQGLGGYAAGVAGGVVGQTPGAALTMMFPGAGLSTIQKVALAAGWGMLSGREHVENANGIQRFADQIKDSGVSASQSLLLNTPSGRIASGTLNALLNLPVSDLEDWINGKKGAGQRAMTVIGTDWLLAAIFTVSKKKGPYAETGMEQRPTGTVFTPEPPEAPPAPPVPPSVPPGPPEPVDTASIRLEDGTIVTGKTHEEAWRKAGKPKKYSVLPPNNGGINKASYEEALKAVEARVAGDPDRAAEHADTSVALMSPQEKEAVGQVASDAVSYVVPKGRIRTVGEVQGPRGGRVGPAARVKGEVTGEPGRIMPEGISKIREAMMETQGGRERLAAAEQHYDYFLSGFGNPLKLFSDWLVTYLPKARALGRAMFESMEPLAKTVRDFRGQFGGVFSEEGYTAEALLRGIRPEMAEMREALPTRIAQKTNLDKDLFHMEQDMAITGSKAESRHGFFHKFRDSELKRILNRFHTGQSDPDPVVNRLFEFYRAGYDAIRQLGKEWGITFNLRDTWVRHAFKNDPDFDLFVKELEVKGLDTGHLSPGEFSNISDMLISGGRDINTIKGQEQLGIMRDLRVKGFELKTYNLEEHFQANISQTLREIEKIRWMRELRERNMAYAHADPQIPLHARDWDTQHTADGNTWHLHPDLHVMWKNAFGRSKLWDSLGGGTAKVFRAVRNVTSGFTLAWSVFHPVHLLHIKAATALTNVLARTLGKTATGEDWQRALTDVLTQGISAVGRDIRAGDIQHLLKVENGTLDRADLTPEERRFMQYKDEAGLHLGSSKDQETHFANNIARASKNYATNVAKRVAPGKAGAVYAGMQEAQQAAKAFDRNAEFGYRFLGSRWVNKWIFGHMIPAMKAGEFKTRLDTLFREKPHLQQDTFGDARRIELTKIGKQIDGQFGEMFYSNLFWDKTAKDIGTSGLLSLGWQLSAFRIYGGAVKDLTRNLTHFDEIIKTTRNEGVMAGARAFLTDRLLYAASYSMISALNNAAITFIATKTLPTGMDYFFPRVGKNPNDADKRVTTPDFTREFPTYWQHIQEHGGVPFGILGGSAQMLQGKLQPFVSSMMQLLENSNYYGQEIYSKDPNAPWIGKLWQSVGYLIQNAGVPIPIKQAMMSRPGATAPFHGAADFNNPQAWERFAKRLSSFDTVMSFLGYSPAPQWTMRTAAENAIVQAYAREHGHSTSVESRDRHDALTDYQNAILSGNVQDQRDAYAHAKKLGLSDRTLSNTAKNAHTPMALRLLPLLSPEEQARQVARMRPEEQRKFIQVMRPSGRAALEKLLHKAVQ